MYTRTAPLALLASIALAACTMRIEAPAPQNGEMEQNDETVTKTCIVSGCSGQVCASEEVITTCEFRPEYACFADAVCEVQADGECGWTETEAFHACIADAAQEPEMDGEDGDIDRCALLPDPGLCRAAIPRYYFDQTEGACAEFTWGGCGGVVPFETMEECTAACEA